MKKFAIFDFDKTITTKDSIAILWKFYGKKMGRDRIKTIFRICGSSIKYFFTKDFSSTKELFAKIFDHMTEEDINYFTDEILPRYFMKDALDEIDSLKKEGYKLLLCSASFEKYMKRVGENLGFDFVIGTRLGRLNKILSKNNRREEKVKRINEYLSSVNEKIDYDNSRSYSDSYRDDKYMMQLTKERFLINSKVRMDGFKNLDWK